jgi:hypothetical protein
VNSHAHQRIPLFLDFDGVINPDVESPDFTDWETFVYQDIQAWGASPAYQILFSPEMVRLLVALPVQLVWLTDWRFKIRDLEPRLGFPELPVRVGPGTGLGEDRKLGWKRAVIEKQVATGQPFVWIDDNLRGQSLDWKKRAYTVCIGRGVPHLALSLNAPAGAWKGEKNKGLRRSDFVLIERFLSDL